MISMDDIRAYRCPRWSQLPDIELYMDQVKSVLDKNLAVFFSGDSTVAITSTMINNYVKQRLVPPPVNKRYDRRHIALFFIITLLKQIMSLSEIRRAISCVTDSYSDEDGYDRFCEIFEQSLRTVFFEEGKKTKDIKSAETDQVIRSICLAYANMLYAGYLMGTLMPEPEPEPPKEKKKRK